MNTMSEERTENQNEVHHLKDDEDEQKPACKLETCHARFSYPYIVVSYGKSLNEVKQHAYNCKSQNRNGNPLRNRNEVEKQHKSPERKKDIDEELRDPEIHHPLLKLHGFRVRRRFVNVHDTEMVHEQKRKQKAQYGKHHKVGKNTGVNACCRKERSQHCTDHFRVICTYDTSKIAENSEEDAIDCKEDNCRNERASHPQENTLCIIFVHPYHSAKYE